MLEKLNEKVQKDTQRSLEEFVEVLHREDDDFYASRQWKRDGYSCYGTRERVLVFELGTITINRRYYYHRKNKQGYFYIDQKHHLKKYQRIAEDIRGKVFDWYGKMAVAAIAKLYKISKQAVYNILTDCGSREICYDVKCDPSINKVYIQADEDHIKQQKTSKLTNQARMIVVYTDRVCVCKGRFELLNKKYFIFTQSDNVQQKWEAVYDYIYAAYPNCKRIYLGSDGGAWIKTSKEIFLKDSTTFIYDLFHFTQSLTRIFGGSKANAQMKAMASHYVRHDMKEDFKNLTTAWFERAEKENRGKEINRKAEYRKILNHWEDIRNNWLLEDYYGTSAEGHVSHYLSSRFSSRPKAFSPERFRAYVRITEYQLNGLTYNLYKKCALKGEGDSQKIGKISLSPGYNNRSSNISVLNHSTNTGFRKMFQRMANGST